MFFFPGPIRWLGEDENGGVGNVSYVIAGPRFVCLCRGFVRNKKGDSASFLKLFCDTDGCKYLGEGRRGEESTGGVERRGCV